jgi:hypothetical protein
MLIVVALDNAVKFKCSQMPVPPDYQKIKGVVGIAE